MSRRIFKYLSVISLLVLSPVGFASFIEATIGTAVVNDATATFFNPSALILLKSPQAISLDSFAIFQTHFTGQSTQVITGIERQGVSNTKTHYFLPSLYFGTPVNDKLSVGIAIVANSFNRELEDNSILRYAQANNSIKGIDFVPAIGMKLTELLSIGANINFSHSSFLTQPVTGFPGLNIPDSQSRNSTSGEAVGADFGVLLKPKKGTLIGYNYRSALSYKQSGSSVSTGLIRVTSHHYHFKFWTPARHVLSINHFLTETFGLVGTLQFIQWSIFKNLHIKGIANQLLGQPLIVDAAVPHYFKNAWLMTLGVHYRATPKWIIRAAGTYNQSPGNSHYQITNGDSVIAGISTGYDISKSFTIDGSYAHAFIQKRQIHVKNRFNINGTNRGSRDSVSIKITVNF